MITALKTIYDPLHNDGYQFWSGIGAGSPLFIAFVAWFHHHNCAQKGCWHKGHPDPEHGHPLCRRHQTKLS